MSQKPDLVNLASGYWYSFAIAAALDLDIFSELSEGKQDTLALSKKISCEPAHLEALLKSLCGMGLLAEDSGGFFLHPEQKPFLDPESPENMLGAFAFNRDLAGLWMNLPECIRTGKPVIPDNPHLGEDPARTRRFVEGMHSRAGIMARNLLSCLQPAAGSEILDVGGGPGTFSLKLAERDPSLHITVLDLPPVVKAASEIHSGKNALKCITFQGGDYHSSPFPEKRDLILYCGAAHQEPEEALDPLFRKMKTALRPGGTLVVVDLMLDPDRSTPVYSALFELNMMLMRPRSKVHSSRSLLQHLQQLGFQDLRCREVPHTPYRMIQGKK